jgi:hypothetical protein
VPDLNRHSPNDRTSAESHAKDRLRIQDLGNEVHLSFEQRIPWKLALKILEALKTEAPQQREDVDRPDPGNPPGET